MRGTEGVVLGALAGLAATMAMTMVMSRAHARLPKEEAYPLPPRELAERMIGGAGANGAVTTAAHFAYGGAAGAVYALLPRSTPGVLYGPLVWVASYMGWIPFTRRLRPATDHPAGRNAVMIGSHVVWGLCVALFLEELEHASRAAFGNGQLADSPGRGVGR